MNPLETLHPLLIQIKEKKAALFLGSGISTLAGCMDGEDVRSELLQIEEIKQQLSMQSATQYSLMEIITHCKKVIFPTENGKKKYEGIIRKATTKTPDEFHNNYLPFIRLLRRIKPFPPLITTNQDQCLADTREFELDRIFYQVTDFNTTQFSAGGVFHIHGYSEDFSNQIWDIPDYAARYTNQQFRDFLISIFSSYSILFLGYSFRDKGLLELLHLASGSNAGNGIGHFALLPDEDQRANDDVVFNSLYNVTIVKYGSVSQFPELVGKWIMDNFGSISMDTEKPDRMR